MKPRKFVRTELHPDAEEYLKDLAEDIGVEPAYIVRLCIARALPEVEAVLRDVVENFKELPHDELKKPTKPLRTARQKVQETPLYSLLEPPPIAGFLETGEMPLAPLDPPDNAAPSPSPSSTEDWQGWESPAEEAAPPVAPPISAPKDDELDPLQAKLKKVTKMRRG